MILINVALLLIVYLMQSKGSEDSQVNMRVSLQCPSRQNQCRNINSDKDRVVTLLDDGLEVMCDTKTDGGGWIIFQRRINGNVSFYRNWAEYKYGFGDFDAGEFYLGNEYIHQLTAKRRYEMRIDLKYKNIDYFSKYSRFRLLGEPEYYRIQVSGYSGNGTDSLTGSHNHNNKNFTTLDRDNDNVKNLNCAIAYHGAWWYSGCHQSNLNGKYNSTDFGVGMNWFGLTGHRDSATYSEMKFREITIN